MLEPRRVESIGGLGINVLEAGVGNPQTLLFIHGFLDSAWSWEAVAEQLYERFHVLAVDLRGHGDSDRVGPGGYYHFFDYLADVEAVAKLAGDGTLSLIGHSMGGTLAGYYSGLRPERVQSLVLLEGLGPPEDDSPLAPRIRAWLDAWARQAGKPAKAYADVAEAAARLQAFDSLLTPARALRLAELTTRQTSTGGREFKHDPLHLTRGPYPFRVAAARELWAEVACPVLYVEGEESSYRALGPEIDRRLQHFARVERRLVPRAGHMMQRHAPEAVAGLIAEHVG